MLSTFVKQSQTMVNFPDWLESQLQDRNMSRADLAAKAGISQTMLSLIYSGVRNPSAKTCNAIAKALKIKPNLVLSAAGLLVEKVIKSPIIQSIETESAELDENDQRDILEYIRHRQALAEQRKNKK